MITKASVYYRNIVEIFDTHKLLIFFVPFMIYMANGREISSGDPTPTVFTAVNLIKKGTIFLDDFHDYIRYNKMPYYISEQKGRIVSNYPIFPGVMAVPVFAPFTWAGMVQKGDGDLVWKYLSKMTGSIYTALSVLFMFLTLKRLIDRDGAFVLAGAYGLGTALWPIASQSLWQHGPGVFWWSVCFYALVRMVESENQRDFYRFSMLAGLATGFAVLCRTTNGIGAVVLCMAMLVRYRWKSVPFILITSVLALMSIGYNIIIFDSWKGGDTVLHSLHWELDRIEGGTWSTPLWIGFPGQLISPSRGIFIFSPFLLFSVWGMVSIRKRPEPVWRLFALTVPIPILMYVVFGKYAVWWGGNSHYGPRYQIESFPFLIVILAAVWSRISSSRGWTLLFILFTLFSIFVQWTGAFCYPGGWAVEPIDLANDKARLWDWSYNQIWTCLTSGIKWPFVGF